MSGAGSSDLGIDFTGSFRDAVRQARVVGFVYARLLANTWDRHLARIGLAMLKTAGPLIAYRRLRGYTIVFVLSRPALAVLCGMKSLGGFKETALVNFTYSSRKPSSLAAVVAARIVNRYAIANVVVSKEQVNELESATGLPTFFLRYGVDTEFWGQLDDDGTDLPEALRGEEFYLLSGDAGRDDALFAAIAATVTGRFVRVTRRPTTREFLEEARSNDPSLQDKLVIYFSVDPKTLRALYRRATATLLLLKPEKEPWGLTVALESLCCGTPVITNHRYTAESFVGDERAWVHLIDVPDDLGQMALVAPPSQGDKDVMRRRVRDDHSLEAEVSYLHDVAAKLRALCDRA